MKALPEEAVAGRPDTGLAAIASRQPVVGQAIGVVRDGRLRLFHGHGLVFRARTRQFVSALFAAAGEHHPAAVIESLMTRQSLQRSWGELQQTYPLIVAPVYTGLPFAAGTNLTTPEVAGIVGGMRMVLAVNVLGLPAVALSVGTAAGLPQSVQVIGPRYREDLYLGAAAAIEDGVGIVAPIDPR
jgi:amidase